jgi:hypothetical protein
VPIVLKCGSLNLLWNTQGLSRPVMILLYLFLHNIQEIIQLMSKYSDYLPHFVVGLELFFDVFMSKIKKQLRSPNEN